MASALPSDRLKVILLVRDVRGYALSLKRKFKQPIRKSFLYRSRFHHKYLRFLREQQIDFLTVGYEELALRPDLTLRKVCDRVGVEFTESMLDPSASTSKLVAGNRMMHDPTKKKNIFYDGKLLTDLRTVYA